ncbi:MAG: peptidoglycan DD-metalloendopeptidase family protein [Endomicrobium sp.]|jgi:septal ring factor EnvC (AmiA/AmiB activator)|nr:peptidoglycan DD-metalloendopeptidase family protein [Endomicrobium sp.]
MKKSTAVILCFFLQFVSAFAQETEIKDQSKQLSEVNKTIKAKQIEKDRLALQERVFKRELRTLNDLIEKNEKRLAQISNEIKTAQKNLDSASKHYDSAFSKSRNLNNAMLDEFAVFHKATFALPYEKDPAIYKVMEAALRDKKESFDTETKSAAASSSEVKRWEKAKRELSNLRAQENKFVTERKNLIKEKNDLLTTTSGKKAAAEIEIKSLNESARELQELIRKLTQIQKQKEKEEREKERAKGKPGKKPPRVKIPEEKRKRALPWPVDGKVTVKFGRNKHKELDAYVISNGIKIKTKDYEQVKSVDSGSVVFTGNFRSYGKVVIIDHKDYFSVYGQLDKILVLDEQKVSRGSVLASLGSGDESVLYFEIRYDNAPDNPMLWLNRGN